VEKTGHRSQSLRDTEKNPNQGAETADRHRDATGRADRLSDL
jgi:hypothetical protein